MMVPEESNKPTESVPETAPPPQETSSVEQPADLAIEEPVDADALEIEPREAQIRPAPPEPTTVEPLRFRYRRKIEVPQPIFPEYLVGKPVLDVTRETKDVMQGLVDRAKVYDPLERLRRSRQEREQRRVNAIEKVRRQQAHLFMNMLLYPFIENFAEGAERSPTEQLRLMIRRGETMGQILDQATDQEIKEIMKEPRITFWIGAITPFLKNLEEEIRKDVMRDWWLDRVNDTKPVYYNIIMREGANGKWWFRESLVDCLSFLKRRIFRSL